MRSRDHRIRRLRVLHVVEYPRQCRDAKRGVRRVTVFDRVHHAWPGPGHGARIRGICRSQSSPSVRHAHARRGARDGRTCDASRSREAMQEASGQMSGDTPTSGGNRVCRRSGCDQQALSRQAMERWTAVVPPTAERVERMLRCTRGGRQTTSLRAVAPGFGAATVERIAINAVMAGCDPEYMPVTYRGRRSGCRTANSICRGSRRRPIPSRSGYRQWAACAPNSASMRRSIASVRARGRTQRSAARCGSSYERRRRAAGRNGPRDPRAAGQYTFLLRGERSGEPVGASARRARIRARSKHGDRRRRRRHDEHE